MIVRCVLLVAAMVALAASAVIVTASTPSASDTRDAPVLRLECRSRGPPEHRCDSPGRRFQFPSCPLDPHCLEHRNTRRPGSHLPNILDPRITTDYNNQPNPNPRRALPDQITANSVDRRTRESLIVHNFDPKKLYRLLRDPKNGGGEGVRSRIREHGETWTADYWFARTFRRAIEHIAATVLMVRDMRAEIEEYLWEDVMITEVVEHPRQNFSGRGSPYEREEKHCCARGGKIKSVLLAVLDVAEERTTTEVIVSKKRVHEMTGFDHRTIARALIALEQLGWLCPTLKAQTTASRFSLRTGERHSSKISYAS